MSAKTRPAARYGWTFADIAVVADKLQPYTVEVGDIQRVNRQLRADLFPQLLPASSTLWLDVGRESYLDLTYQSLKVHNDLSHFPVPFPTSSHSVLLAGFSQTSR
jgi:hypothetical protein